MCWSTIILELCSQDSYTYPSIMFSGGWFSSLDATTTTFAPEKLREDSFIVSDWRPTKAAISDCPFFAKKLPFLQQYKTISFLYWSWRSRQLSTVVAKPTTASQDIYVTIIVVATISDACCSFSCLASSSKSLISSHGKWMRRSAVYTRRWPG